MTRSIFNQPPETPERQSGRFNTAAFVRAAQHYLADAPVRLRPRFPYIASRPAPARILSWVFSQLAEDGYDEAFARGAGFVVHISGNTILIKPYERPTDEPHDAADG